MDKEILKVSDHKYDVRPYFEATVRLDPVSYRMAGENNATNHQPKTLGGSMRRNDEATAAEGRLVLDYKAPVTPAEDPMRRTLKLRHGRITVNSQKVIYSFQMETADTTLAEVTGTLLSECAEAAAFVTK